MVIGQWRGMMGHFVGHLLLRIYFCSTVGVSFDFLKPTSN